MQKRCYICKTEKDASEFYKDKSREDGCCNRCKKCSKKRKPKHSKWESELATIYNMRCDDVTYEAIAKIYGVSRQRIRQIAYGYNIDVNDIKLERTRAIKELAELAEIVGCSIATVHNCLSGKSNNSKYKNAINERRQFNNKIDASKTSTRLYQTRAAMIQRCYNKNNPGYKYYGGKGVKVCQEWLNDFEIFREWALANGYTDELTIDRENSSGDYEPDNCQFVTKSENSKKAQADKKLKVKLLYLERT